MNGRKIVALWAVMVLVLTGCSGRALVRVALEDDAVHIIFMHHSTGENLIWQGGVREAFSDLGYAFWDHGYNDDGLVDADGSDTGIDWDMPDDNTDPDGWYNIFSQPVTAPPTNTFSHMLQYDVIIFKSCFPASDIYDEAMFEAYRRYFLSMRDVMDQHPDKVFIPFTTPPLVPNSTEPENAARARRWAEYLTSDEYLGGHPNIFVFDFFSLLADDDGYLRAEYRPDEEDSHPNELANRTIGPIFVDFVDQAVQAYAPGAAPPTKAPGDGEPEIEAGPPVSALEPGQEVDDFEGGDFDDRWWFYTDEGTTLFECAPEQPGRASDHALRIVFDISADSYPGCGTGFDAAQDWSDADGLGFSWRADQPGLEIALVLFVEDPTQTSADLEGLTPFEAHLQTPGDKWTAVALEWDDFTKAEWAGEGGIDVLDPTRVTGLSFDFGDWEKPQRGSVWIDDLQLLQPTTGGAQPAGAAFDKFALWVDGPHLRGANVWQRVVVPEVDGPEFLGSGYVGPPYTQEDFDRLAALGANYVNISGPGLFTERPPYVLDGEVQANLDNLLEMIANADMFAVISARTGPGRSDFTFYDEGIEEWGDVSLVNDDVWLEQAAQDAWVEMWRYTAERYRDNPFVIGYDLMCEPNAAGRLLEIYEPAEFYPAYAGTLYDWNQFYPRLVEAIREVDADTPILVSGMGWGAVWWLPFLEPTDDPRTVYVVHQYEPQMQYTHQEPPAENTYPGTFDLDWDGVADEFNRGWLDELLTIVDAFKERHSAPVAVNEFGVMRWVPGAARFMADELGLFEQRGMNHAFWAFSPAWPPYAEEVDAFDFLHGPDPNHHANVESSDLIEVIRVYWSRNTVRPSIVMP
jgi:hypothetical protein